MEKKLTSRVEWINELAFTITEKGRVKASSPGGFCGFGRTKSDAIRNCAEHAPPGFFNDPGLNGSQEPTLDI